MSTHEPQRIAKLLARAGIASRREIERMIEDRRIAIDGKPAKPFVVGTKVEEGLWLQSVAPRRATLAPAMDGPAAFSLEMPLPKRS